MEQEVHSELKGLSQGPSPHFLLQIGRLRPALPVASLGGFICTSVLSGDPTGPLFVRAKTSQKEWQLPCTTPTWLVTAGPPVATPNPPASRACPSAP